MSPKNQSTFDTQTLASHEEWHSTRLQALVTPQGNLSLIQTRWLPEGVEVSDEEALLGHPSSVTITRLKRSNVDTGQPEFGVRLWDAASSAIEHFSTVTAFDYNPDWVIEAEFTPVEGARTIAFEHIRDNGGSRELAVPGDITFVRNGHEFRLSAFDDGGVLLLVFGDSTNGRPADDGGTYGSGRFLFVERPSASDRFDAQGPVILDFNRAFVPPCGFSIEYNCPLPPAQNRFSEDVTAGERLVVFSDGYELH
ncbi:MAG: hypothetical protein ACJAS7_000079 [Alpinimonas sp.]|jgi:uncharacterized protein (DUF1684 family)